MFEILIKGKVFDIRSSSNSVYLQFLRRTEGGSLMYDVKVEGALVSDLRKYVDKVVLLEDVKISGDAFNRFYKIVDVTKIKEVSK